MSPLPDLVEANPGTRFLVDEAFVVFCFIGNFSGSSLPLLALQSACLGAEPGVYWQNRFTSSART